jgi:hypothetical protein
MSEYELGLESRREFCVRHGLATSTLDYRRHRNRIECKRRLLRGSDEWSMLFVDGYTWRPGRRGDCEAGGQGVVTSSRMFWISTKSLSSRSPVRVVNAAIAASQKGVIFQDLPLASSPNHYKNQRFRRIITPMQMSMAGKKEDGSGTGTLATRNPTLLISTVGELSLR